MYVSASWPCVGKNSPRSDYFMTNRRASALVQCPDEMCNFFYFYLTCCIDLSHGRQKRESHIQSMLRTFPV